MCMGMAKRLSLCGGGIKSWLGREVNVGVQLWAQMAEVVVLWGIFLLTQQLKAGYPNCTWQYFAIFGAQVLFLLGVTSYSVRCAPPWLPPASPAGPAPLRFSVLRSGVLSLKLTCCHKYTHTHTHTHTYIQILSYLTFYKVTLSLC